MLSGSSINHSGSMLRKLFSAAFSLGADDRLERPKGSGPQGLTGSFDDRSPAAAVPVRELSLMFKEWALALSKAGGGALALYSLVQDSFQQLQPHYSMDHI